MTGVCGSLWGFGFSLKAWEDLYLEYYDLANVTVEMRCCLAGSRGAREKLFPPELLSAGVEE